MRITLLTIGSLGDVLPCLALGRELRSRGHEARIAALSGFRGRVEAAGLEYLEIAGEARSTIEELIGVDVGPLEYFRGLERLLDGAKVSLFPDLERACDDTDLVAYSVLGGIAYHPAQARGLPCVRLMFVPLDPTSDFPTMTAPRLFGGRFRAYNRLTYALGDLMWARFTRRKLGPWRAHLGLRELRPLEFPYRRGESNAPVPTLCAFSEALLPKPAGWGDHIRMTGFLTDPPGYAAAYSPDPGLERFLSEGPKPVYVGFGSMVGGDFSRLLSIVLGACELAGTRAVLSSGWGGLGAESLPSWAFQSGYLPHEWLFTRVAAAVHHGGAGTTAASLRAGLPTVIVPFGGDQPFWGARVAELGAGPRPLSVRRLSASALAAAIREATGDPAMGEAARAIGRRLASERGPAAAADYLEEIAAGW